MDNSDINKPAIKERWRELFLVVFAAVILFFPLLGKRDLWTAGEARVAQVAVQMVRSGDWIVPHLGNDLRIAKPPLSYWLVCLTSPFDADKIDELKSRIPSAIAGVLAAVLLALWAREVIGGYGGLLAGIAFVSTSACWWQARNSTIEMTLLFSTVAALYCWWRYHKDDSSVWLYLTYFAAALAALDKGPVTPPLILLIIITYLFVSLVSLKKDYTSILLIIVSGVCWILLGLLYRVFCIYYLENNIDIPTSSFAGFIKSIVEFNFWKLPLMAVPPLIIIVVFFVKIFKSYYPDKLKLAAHLKGIFIFFAVTLPWAIAVTLRVGKNAEGKYITVNEWFYQSAGRFKGFDHIKEIWYFLPKILGDGQPWVFFALLGLAAYFLYRKSIKNIEGLRFFVVWAIVTFIFFSIPASKKSYYILPIYPAFALLAAWSINGLLNGFFSKSKTEKVATAFCEFFGSTLVFTGLTLPFFYDVIFERFEKLAKYSGYISEIMIASALAILTGSLLCYAGTKKRWKIVPIVCFIAAAAAFLIHSLQLDKMNAYKGDRDFCLAIKDRVKEGDVIYTYAMGGQPVYRYYLDRHVQRIINPVYLAYALHDLDEGSRLILGLDERDWLKFNSFYLLFYDAEKVKNNVLCDVVEGLKARYPDDVTVLASASLGDKSFVMVQIGPNVPKKDSTQKKWEEWNLKNERMTPEIYETLKRLKSMGVKPVKMSHFFNEFTSILSSGRLWVEFDLGRDKNIGKLNQENKIPERHKKGNSRKSNDGKVKKQIL